MTVSARDDCIRGVVGVLEEDGRFLTIQRSEHVRFPGMWCFPGGAIEPGETPAQAIVREVREELGLHVKPLGKLWSWVGTDGALHLLWWKLARVGGRLTPNPAEVQSVKWMTAEEIRRQADMARNNVSFLDHYQQGR